VIPENIYTHLKMVIGKSEGKGVSKAKLFKRKYEAKLEIPGGGLETYKQKNHPWRRYGYFLKPHILRNIYS